MAQKEKSGPFKGCSDEVRFTILDLSRVSGSVPLKKVGVALLGDRLCWLTMEPDPIDFKKEMRHIFGANAKMDTEMFHSVQDELFGYLTGKRENFTIPLKFVSGTPFQRRTWKVLLKIPFGETMTYGELARKVGSPQAARAVGGACGANPIAIIVPCHRVVGSGGSLTGFGGGLKLKKALLELEGAL